MLPLLVSHNDDIKRLVEKGFAVAIDGGFLIVRDIPYLDSAKALQWGAFVAKLIFKDATTVVQDDHQILFAGSVPYGLDGNPIPNLAGGTTTVALSEENQDVVVQRSFSNKPIATGVYTDFYHKIDSYLTNIAGPAMAMYHANPYTFRVINSIPNSVFKFADTMTSRAEIVELSAKFKDDVIAIIGLGGTGSYVLDFMVKTPVKEIRAFDLDNYHVHNAFRSPGRLLSEGELGKLKAEIYRDRYDNFRTGLSIKAKVIDDSCAGDLDGVTFAFVCVDKGSSRKAIFDLLLSMKIPFIDAAMGLQKKDGCLSGSLNVTRYTVDNAAELIAKGFSQLVDVPADEYKVNIQIGELNALNACLAVARYKQIRGFYREEIPYDHLMFCVGDLKSAGVPNE